jgi:hypothetical protein
MSQSPSGLLLGWQFTPGLDEPEPPPGRPELTEPPGLGQGWVSAQRRICQVMTRPARLGAAASVAAAGGLAGLWLGGLAALPVAAATVPMSAACAVACATSAMRGRRRTAALIAAERQRIATAGQALADSLAGAQREHAEAYRRWQRRRVRFERQPAWFGLELSPATDRVDIAGGTSDGWSAALTTMLAPVLSAGGTVTVVDLTEAMVAAGLIAKVRRSGVQAATWVLPGDLPRLTLGRDLDGHALADVLARAAASASGTGRDGPGHGDRPGPDAAADGALLGRVLGALPPRPLIAQVTAALRVLADVGDPRADLRSGLLTAGQLDRIGRLFGRGASERIVLERAFVLEARLRLLDWLGAEPLAGAPAPLMALALDPRADVTGNLMLSTYLVAAVTAELRQAPAGEPWGHVLCLLGAEQLSGDLVDRLAHACQAARAGLIVAYRSLPAHVRERLGRGNAAIAVMRLGNGDEARAASDLIGTEHRLVLGQLTSTAGVSSTGTWGASDTVTSGTADSVTGSYSVTGSEGVSRGRGRGHQGGAGPFGDFSRSSSRDASYSVSESGSGSRTEGVNAGTSEGSSYSAALGESLSLARTVQRSRELLVEPGELQQLPPTAMIVSYPAPGGRKVVLADVNPEIGALPGAVARADW